jgi:S1-C subfamily serine protease
LVSVGAAAAAIAAGLFLANAGTPSAPAGIVATSSLTTLATALGAPRPVPVVTQRTARSMVALQVTTGTGIKLGCAVAVAKGGFLVTTADLEGMTGITATLSDGHSEQARVVATDQDSDMALLRVPTNLPVARFRDDEQVAPGHWVMVMAGALPAGTADPHATWTAASVDAIGLALGAGPAAGLGAIGVTNPTSAPVAGAALVDRSGAVLGLFDGSAGLLANGDMPFLPAELITGVAGDLAHHGQVLHGWLDFTGTDGGGALLGGAVVVGVQPGGAAANVLRPGDVIEQLDGQPVRTMAELRARLYVMPPGTTVQLKVDRDGAVIMVAAHLSSSP